jgi:hypothetical protein
LDQTEYAKDRKVSDAEDYLETVLGELAERLWSAGRLAFLVGVMQLECQPCLSEFVSIFRENSGGRLSVHTHQESLNWSLTNPKGKLLSLTVVDVRTPG